MTGETPKSGRSPEVKFAEREGKTAEDCSYFTAVAKTDCGIYL